LAPRPILAPVEVGAFDTAAARAPEVKLAPSTAIGSFDTAKNIDVPRPGTDKPAVGNAGFGAVTEVPSRQAARSAGPVADAGFSGAPASRGTSARDVRDVRSSGFDTQAAPRGTPARPAPTGPVDVPVEILFKPTPAYTDEARTLKLEGDVVLEVEFSATQEVRVLRVVRGLGHGLDESATKAANQIRFKPAQANGKAVDFHATLHIVFRLT
jgi:TonB family protein